MATFGPRRVVESSTFEEWQIAQGTDDHVVHCATGQIPQWDDADRQHPWAMQDVDDGVSEEGEGEDD